MANNLKGAASNGNTLVRSEQLNEDIVDVVKEYWEGGSYNHGLSLDSNYDTLFKVEGKVKAEIADRIAGDSSLQTRLAAEEGARASGDSSLETRLAAEESLRASEVGSLDTRVAADEAALAAEIAATNSDVSSLDTRVAADEAALAAEIAATNADVGSIDTRVAAEESARAAADLSLETRLAADEAALAAEIAATNADVGSIDTRVSAVEGSWRQYSVPVVAAGTETIDLDAGPGDAGKSVVNNSIQLFLNGIRLHFDGAATSDATCTSGDYWYDAATKQVHIVDCMADDVIEAQWNLL